jgi:hypothetical protein
VLKTKGIYFLVCDENINLMGKKKKRKPRGSISRQSKVTVEIFAETIVTAM